MTRVYLGLDTSCYTTSVAVVDAAGTILAAERRLLSVPEGSRGLRQQEMVFQHVTALPGLYAKAVGELPEGARFSAVGVSTRPRDAEGSYMPAFTVGEGFARVVADTLKIPLIQTDHQAGHIAAGRAGGVALPGRFLAMHLSGGTTELLLCGEGKISLLGGTSDISAGQLVDRTGVALSLPFPAGPSLEACARAGLAAGLMPSSHLRTSLKGLSCSLSGAEAQVTRDIEGGKTPEEVALSVYSLLSRVMERMLAGGCAQTGCGQAMLVGGVASSALFRQMLLQRILKKETPLDVSFALPELSGDNAVGVAWIARERHNHQ